MRNDTRARPHACKATRVCEAIRVRGPPRVPADGAFLAIGSHDNVIYIYSVTEEGRRYNRFGRCTVSTGGGLRVGGGVWEGWGALRVSPPLLLVLSPLCPPPPPPGSLELHHPPGLV